MILKVLLSTRIIWIIFIKILKNKIQIRNIKYWSFLIIWLLICLVIKKLNPVVSELFIKGRKLNISLAFITQSCFAVPKNIRLNSTHYFITKILCKAELQQVAFNHSSDIDFKNFVNCCKKCTAKPYSFLATDSSLVSDNLLRFRENLLERIWKLIMTIDSNIRDEKLLYYIKREAVKISALSSSKINNYEYLTGEEILSNDQSEIIEQAKFTYSFLGKGFKKQIKTIEDVAEKQTNLIEDRFEKQILGKIKNLLIICFQKILYLKKLYMN